MSRDLMILFAIAMALMVMQMIGGFLKCWYGTKAWLVF